MSVVGLKNELIGFAYNKESLPYGFDKFTSKKKLRQLFLCLIQPMIKDSFSFSKYEMLNLCNFKLETVFIDKIKKELPISFIKCYKKPKKFFIDIKSTKVINNYLLKENKNLIYSNNELLPLAKIISLCFVNNKMQLLFDVNLLFHQFVYNKIYKKNRDKLVIDSGNSISIMGSNCEPLKIYTSWRAINSDNLDIKHELDFAVESIKQSEFKNIYLVFPKAKNFKKHIPIKVNELQENSYNIKVVPYSLRSTIRNLKTY